VTQKCVKCVYIDEEGCWRPVGLIDTVSETFTVVSYDQSRQGLLTSAIIGTCHCL